MAVNLIHSGAELLILLFLFRYAQIKLAGTFIGAGLDYALGA